MMMLFGGGRERTRTSYEAGGEAPSSHRGDSDPGSTSVIEAIAV